MHGRRGRSILSLALAAVIVAGACGSDNGDPGADAPTGGDTTASSAMDHSAAPMDHDAADPAASRPSFCSAVGNGSPVGGHGNGSHVAEIYAGKSKGPLSDDDCTALSAQISELVAMTEGLDTRGAAEAEGWYEIAEYIGGLGTHHTMSFPLPTPGDADGFATPPFEVAKPTFLIYGGESVDAPLVGAAYIFIGKGDPPAAFAGENDWWHEHNTTCIGAGGKILAGAEEVPDEECTALGGHNIRLTGPGGFFGDNGNWLLHVWLEPYEYRPDIFASGHPCMLETGVAPMDDPCWETAHRDPSEGPPPGDDSAHAADHD